MTAKTTEGHFWEKEVPPPRWERRYRMANGDWCAAEEYAKITIDRGKLEANFRNGMTHIHEDDIPLVEEIIAEMKRIRANDL